MTIQQSLSIKLLAGLDIRVKPEYDKPKSFADFRIKDVILGLDPGIYKRPWFKNPKTHTHVFK